MKKTSIFRQKNQDVVNRFNVYTIPLICTITYTGGTPRVGIDARVLRR